MDRRSVQPSSREPERRTVADRRDAGRHRTVLRARLLHDSDGRRSQDVRLRDISREGARAVTAGDAPLPKTGWLVVPSTGEGHAFRTIWSSTGQAGLAFDQTWDLRAPDAPPEARGLRRLWLELSAR